MTHSALRFAVDLALQKWSHCTVRNARARGAELPAHTRHTMAPPPKGPGRLEPCTKGSWGQAAIAHGAFETSQDRAPSLRPQAPLANGWELGTTWKTRGSSVGSRTVVLKWRWRRRVKKIPCSLCFFLPSSFQEWSLFGSRVKKETFALDQFRQQAGDEHSLKENQQERKKPKHPKGVVTWGGLPALSLPVRCRPGPVKRWIVTGPAGRRRYSCLRRGPEGAQRCQGTGRRWWECSSGEAGADRGCRNWRE